MRSDGLDLTIAHVEHEFWTEKAKLAIRQLATTDRGFDADHVLDMVGPPPTPERLGAIFSALQRAGEIEFVGCHVGRRHRLLRTWWGVQR